MPVIGIPQDAPSPTPTPPPDSPSPDLISAVVAYFDANGTLVAAFPGGIVNGAAEPEVDYPFVEVEVEEDVEPGLSLEDTPYDLTFRVYGGSADEVKSAGKVLIDGFDSPNLNANSTRAPLVWATGTETVAVRESATIRRTKRPGKGGLPLWRYEVPYRFWCNSTPP